MTLGILLFLACLSWAVILGMGMYASRETEAMRRRNRQRHQEWRASWTSSAMQDAMGDGE